MGDIFKFLLPKEINKSTDKLTYMLLFNQELLMSRQGMPTGNYSVVGNFHKN